jgi:hypothetical protein
MIENGDISKVEKVKCPKYTGITMGLRSILDEGLDDSVQFNDHMTDWSKYWCLTAEGRQYWHDFYWDALLKARSCMPRDSTNPIGWHIRLAMKVTEEWESMTHDELMERRGEIRSIRDSELSKAPPRLLGQSTLVIPFCKDFRHVERVLDGAKMKYTQKKVDKSWKGWFRLTSMPTNPDNTTGNVYQLPPSDSLMKWQQDKLDSIDDSVIKVPELSKLLEIVYGVLQSEIDEDKVDSPIETELRIETNKIYDQIKSKIDAMETKRGTEDFRPLVFMMSGPQCIGKSRITKRLESENVVVCSADAHMGPRFDWTQLKRCHSMCAKSVYDAIKMGKHVIIDNTNLKAVDRSLYNYICKIMGVELFPIIIAPDMWLTSGVDLLEKLIKVLTCRCNVRAKEEGKVIDNPDKVIRKTIDNSRLDFRTHTDGKVESIDKWLQTFPEHTYPLDFTLDRGRVMMYRSRELNKIASESLENPHLKDRDNYREELLFTQMSRGKDEFHITLIGPQDIKKIDSKTRKVIDKESKTWKNSPDFVEPKVVGVGRASNELGDIVFYLIIDWEWGQSIRKSYGLDRKDFHITLMWSGENDIRDVDKGLDTLLV